MNCEGCLKKNDCDVDGSGCDCDEKYFHVGQIIPLKGRLFRVRSIGPAELKLELVR